MTREEFGDLLKRRQAIRSEVEKFEAHVCYVLSQVGHPNDDRAKVADMEIVDGVASIYYLERRAHASCCGDDWETAKIPAHWIFGGDWKAEHAAKVAAAEQAEKDEVLAQERADKEAQEAHDKAEFERLN